MLAFQPWYLAFQYTWICSVSRTRLRVLSARSLGARSGSPQICRGRRMCTVAMLVSMGVVSGYDCCWCDKDTPASKHKIMFENTPMQLVFSDEFNGRGRTFENGKDSKWTALDIGDTSNQGKAFYLPNQTFIAEDPAFKGVRALVLKTDGAGVALVNPSR